MPLAWMEKGELSFRTRLSFFSTTCGSHGKPFPSLSKRTGGSFQQRVIHMANQRRVFFSKHMPMMSSLFLAILIITCDSHGEPKAAFSLPFLFASKAYR